MTLLVLLLLLGAAGAPDAGSPPVPGTDMAQTTLVIPPGQEKTITALLGGDDALAGCKLDSAHVERTTITARWSCAGGKSVEGVVGPASMPGAAVVSTDKFHVAAAGSTPWPDGFAVALQARLAAQGGSFDWAVARPNPKIAAGTYPDAVRKPKEDLGRQTAPSKRHHVVLIALALAVMVAAGLVAWRMGRRKA